MFESIWQDLKREYRMGNMITRIIITCVAVYVGVLVVLIISRGFDTSGSAAYQKFVHYLSLPGSFLQLLKQPWSLVTHMFLHEGFFHLFWNMLWLYWFGRIAGDLLGDRRILPLYLLSGLCGAAFFLLYTNITGHQYSYALGASAAVSGVVIAAAVTSPDYVVRLILLGDIKIKYIAAFRILMDLVGASGMDNTGGHIAHLGGAFYGWLYVSQLRNGVDLGSWLERWIERAQAWLRSSSSPRTSRPRKNKMMTVAHSTRKRPEKQISEKAESAQERLDQILDKINEKGLKSLTEEERDFLENSRDQI